MNTLKRKLLLSLLVLGLTSLHAQGTFTVGTTTPGADFISLSVAVSSATVTTGSTLEILDDQICNNITISKNLTIRKSPTVTGDVTLNYSGTVRHFTISANTSVSFEDLIFQGPNATSSGTNLVSGGGIASAGANSILTLTNCKITGCRGAAGGAVSFATASQAVTLDRTEVTNCSSTNTGGGVHCVGTLAITNSTISNNAATTSGGGVNCTGVTTISNSTISNNTSASTGGGGVFSSGVSTITNSTLSNNTATATGGGIYATGALTLNNVTVSGNKASWSTSGTYSGANNGGGVYANSNLTLQGVIDVNNNGAGGSGGGIYKNTLAPAFDVTALTTLKVNNNLANTAAGGGIYTVSNLDFSTVANLETIEIENNTAVTTGGGIHATGTLTVVGSIVGNSAKTSGGGIYAGALLELKNTTISGNKAGYDGTSFVTGDNRGGGVFANNNLILSGTVTVSNNTAGNSGGGIYKSSTASTSITATDLISFTVDGNEAKGLHTSTNGLGGGIYIASAIPLELVNGVANISNNTAKVSGGGIYTTGTLNLKDATISNNTAQAGIGGGIYTNNTILATNVRITGNNAALQGGGVYSSVQGLNFYNSTISGNKAGKEGGGIYTLTGAANTSNYINAYDLTLSDNVAGWDFTNNIYSSVLYAGGGIFANGSIAFFDNLTVTNNIATGDGGGICKNTGLAGVDMTGVKMLTLTGNQSINGNGGGIYSAYELSFTKQEEGADTRAVISGNKAPKGSGGAIYTTSDLYFTYINGGSSTDIINNIAGKTGGAIYAGGLFILNKATLSGNTATNQGGAIYLTGAKTMSILKSTFTGNISGSTGGAVFSASTNTTQEIANCTFYKNNANTNGGAISFSSGSGGASVYYCTFNGNHTTNNISNAIYWSAGTLNLNGNIIYGNGTESDSEITRANGTLIANYNIVREQTLAGTSNKTLTTGSGTTIFASVDAGNPNLGVLADNGGHTQTIMIKTKEDGGLANAQIPMAESMTFGGNSIADQRDVNRLTVNMMDIGSVQIPSQACQRIDPTPIVWYVDKNTLTPGDGMDDISHPATDLAAVLNNPCLMTGDIIKVTSGTYFSTDTDPNNTFTLKKGVSIFGSYTSDFSETGRDFKNHPTVLDGKGISYHVVSLFTGMDEPSQIDGVVIQNGKALGSSASQTFGGGIYFFAGKLLLSNAIVKDNVSLERGGGIYVAPNGVALTVYNSSFTGNKSGYDGTNLVSPSTTSATAAELLKSSGGAICAEGNLELQGSLYFDSNGSGGNGGSIFKGPQNEFIATHLDSLIITNSTAQVNDNNNGNWGGGGIYTMLNTDFSALKKLKIHNAIATLGQGGGIFINNKAIGRLTLSVNNADFYNCRAQGGYGDGGAIESYGGTTSLVIVKNSSFDNCYCTRYGGALGIGNVLKLEGTVKINNSTAGTNGGAITHWMLSGGFPEHAEFDVQQCDSLIITNCKVTGAAGGTGPGTGGGIWISKSNLDLSPVNYVLIENNISSADGGGIKFNGANNLTLGNAIIKGNKAGTKDGTTFSANKGGGVHTTGAITIQPDKKVIVDGNMSGSDGGGLYCGGVFTANQPDSLVFSNNEAGKASSGNGGGIYIGTTGTSTINNAIFTNNKAKTNGGGISISSALNGTNCTFDQNSATLGGGIYATGTSAKKISNSTFRGNTTTGNSGGGAIYSATANDVLQIALSTFTGNTTKDNVASAFYFNNATGKTLNGNIIYGNGTGAAANAEISVAPTAASYNITRNLNLGGTNKILGDGELLNLFETATLTDNGGKTPTVMIKKGGAAHNYIPKSVVDSWTAWLPLDALTTDQRGIDRPVGCGEDVGAVEINNEDIPVIAFTIPEICHGTIINLKDYITSATHVRDTLFYSNAAYTTQITNPTTYTVTQSPVYVRFNTTSNCVKDTIMTLTINPLPATPIITNSAFCVSGTIAGLTARVTNPASGGAISIYDSENSETPLTSETALINNTIYYISQTSNKGCVSPRVAVTVTLQQMPVLTLTSNEYYLCSGNSFTLHGSVTNTSPVIPWYQWQVMNPSTGTYIAGNSSDFYPGVTFENQSMIADATFTPSASVFDANGVANVKLRVSTGACSYKEAFVALHKNVSNPAAEISIANQPVLQQTACVDTAYVVKIKNTGSGGLSNIKVTLFDWKYTDLTVVKAEYKHADSITWKPANINNSADAYQYVAEIPSTFKLVETSDSMLVRFTVRPECGFYAGSNMQFKLQGKDACGQIEIAPKTVESDTIHLNFGINNDIKYKLVSHLNQNGTDISKVDNSMSNKTITWTVDYYELVRGNANFATDSIYFRIPTGMVLDENSFQSSSSVQGRPRVKASSLDQGTEYVLPLSADVLTGRVSFSFDFTVTTAAKCGVEQLYMEIIRQGKLTCATSPQPCSFFETLAQSYPQLQIEWYDLDYAPAQSATSIGRMHNGVWTGKFDIQTTSNIPAGTQIPFDFYADKNGNMVKDPDENTKQTTTFNHTLSGAVSAGGTFQVDITQPVPVAIGANDSPQELLAYVPAEALVCEALTVPIVPVIGREIVCQGDTVLYQTTPGMEMTTISLVDAISGATPQRISNEGNGDNWTDDIDKSQAKIVITHSKSFGIKAQYRTAGKQLLNATVMTITPIARPALAYYNDNDTIIICNGTSVDLSQVVHDTNNANPDTWYYYQKQSDGNYTLLDTKENGASYIVSPSVNTTYGISAAAGELGCESKKADFTIIVNEMPADGNIVGENNICSGNEDYSISNAGNGLLYKWTVTGTENAIVGNDTTSEVTVDWNETGELKAVYATSEGCSAEKVLQVAVRTTPVISNLSVSNTPCDPSLQSTVTFTAQGQQDGWQYLLDGSSINESLSIQGDDMSFALTEPKTGRYAHQLIIHTDEGCESTPNNFNTAFYPLASTWTANGVAGNWNDPDNWNNGVPGECTYVTIPSNLSTYPVLQKVSDTYWKPVCDTIDIKFGAEIARTDYLEYNGAKVELTVNGNRWYMFAPPLQSMVPADIYVSSNNPVKQYNPYTPGYGLYTYAQLFSQTNPQTGKYLEGDWSGPFTTPNLTLNPGIGFGVWIDDGTPAGTFKPTTYSFPKHDANVNYYHPTTGAITKSISINREGKENRFIYESVLNFSTGDITLSSKGNGSGKLAIVGNPFMSHWDFDAFYNQNSGLIANEYKVLLADGNYGTYKIGSSNMYDLDKMIAPMQSIIVSSIAPFTALTTNVNQVGVKAGGSGMLRAAKAQANTKDEIIIQASTGKLQNKTLLVHKEEVTNEYQDKKDSRKLFGKADSGDLLTVYTRSSDGFALDINSFGETEQVIPIGYWTTKKDKITLNFRGLENFMGGYDVILQDLQTGQETDLRENAEYTFSNSTVNKYVDGRLFISFRKLANEEGGTTDDKQNPADETKGISVISRDNTIQVISTDESNLQSVQIFDIQGRLLNSTENINQISYTYNIDNTGIYIVKATTSKSTVTRKVMIGKAIKNISL